MGGRPGVRLQLQLQLLAVVMVAMTTSSLLRVRARSVVAAFSGVGGGVGVGGRGRVGLALRASTSTGEAAATRKGGSKGSKPDSVYKSTVILPQTDFSQRANAINREPELQKFWADNKIYESLCDSNEEKGGGTFLLHDGPPYANGDLHMGHALNKVLKDFINRYQLLQGKSARFVPGWDCHGLPIELKVLQNMKSKERQGLGTLDLRKKAAAFAEQTVDQQRESFKRYGVWGFWDEPYLTLRPEYEAAQIEVFGKMFQEGHIYRGRKPVNWSPSSRTALAEAELEYPDDHVSTSMYAGFEVVELSPALSAASAEVSLEGLKVAVWTTTPWTMPGNLAVAVNEKLQYSVVSHPSLGGSTKLIVAKDLIPTLSRKFGVPEGELLQEVTRTFTGAELQGTRYQHPLYERQSEIVIGGDYITTESGTGLVHTAPGHGQEDYQTGQKYGLPLLSPVDDAGKFTEEAGPLFQGLSVLAEGNEAVLVEMEKAGALLLKEAYPHKYPYDWRTKKPTIFRATDQWFASVDRFRDRAMSAIDEVQWIPQVGKNRITGMVEGRTDWCISRQRTWGVPIPVFYHKETGEPLMSKATIAHIQSVVAERGTDCWWELPVRDLLPADLADQADDYEKGKDTMDVWFDSGSSWNGVVNARAKLSTPADLYLEGSDQHRGWFQSSLLTSVASTGAAPYKAVLTHGFVLDEKGFKMSKSLGNVVDPREIIEGGKNQKERPPWGADVLRLWVSTVDYSGDVPLGFNILKQVGESYRKLRNTFRYLVGNVFDFDPSKDAVAYENLPALDKWVLGRMSTVMEEVDQAYNTFQFYRASQAILRFTVADLSNFYLDVAKDRLYISSPDDLRRRSCQTVLHILLVNLCKSIAPILPHMAEDVWQNLPFDDKEESVFQAGWFKEEFAELDSEFWSRMLNLRGDVNKALEAGRAAKAIGASAQAEVFIHCDDGDFQSRLASITGDDILASAPQSTNGVDDLRFLLMVSKVHVVDSPEEVASRAAASEEGLKFTLRADEGESGCTVGICPAEAPKCERCWYHCSSVGSSAAHPTLCSRCSSVVEGGGFDLSS